MSYKIVILSLAALHAFTATALPPCVCTRNLSPVCGSDGNTYGNECLLNCKKHQTGAELTIARAGPCDLPAEQLCICPFNYSPVCGNDGNTYPNKCSLLCQRQKNPEIDVASERACSDEVKVAEQPCICTDDLKEVCGSDGNTYANPCLLNCATAKDSTLSIKKEGKCDDRVKVAELNLMQGDQPSNCFCTKEMTLVCGSDGITYGNACVMRCMGGGQVTVAKNGACEF